MKIKSSCPGISISVNGMNIPSFAEAGEFNLSIGDMSFEIEFEGKELVTAIPTLVSNFKEVVSYVRDIVYEDELRREKRNEYVKSITDNAYHNGYNNGSSAESRRAARRVDDAYREGYFDAKHGLNERSGNCAIVEDDENPNAEEYCNCLCKDDF